MQTFKERPKKISAVFLFLNSEGGFIVYFRISLLHHFTPYFLLDLVIFFTLFKSVGTSFWIWCTWPWLCCLNERTINNSLLTSQNGADNMKSLNIYWYLYFTKESEERKHVWGYHKSNRQSESHTIMHRCLDTYLYGFSQEPGWNDVLLSAQDLFKLCWCNFIVIQIHLTEGDCNSKSFLFLEIN